ncbi:MAG: ABC transporter ATP-binding protein [Paracoccaceae bacterium]
MADQTSSAVSIRQVSKSFGRGASAVRVLDGVSAEIGQREFFTLLGPSGCGKTTLLRLIAGFEEIVDGEILIDDQRVNDLPPFRRPVNTVFQNYALFPHLTVAQNVAFALEMQGLPRAETDRRTGEVLEMVRMGQYARRRPAELSGGQQQRVALARALAPRPRVLLLDEPLSALDLKLRKEMQIELKQLQHEAGITFIFVTHDQDEALTLSDRVAVMQGGRILQLGSPRDIYERPAHRFVADFIGDINLMDGRAEASGTVRLGCGAVLSCGASHASGTAVTVAIRPEHATLAAPGTGALDAEVVHSAYLGTAILHQLRLADGSHFLMRDSRSTEAPPNPGTRVGIHLPAQALQVFAA